VIHQYYYHNNECKADSAESKDCICWHDEGTGPFVNERHDHKNRRIYNLNLHWRVKPDELHWRVKPDELADLKLRCEEQQQKLDEMAKAFSQQQDRIKRLEEAGDAMSWTLNSENWLLVGWRKAKESKP
jgi:hypothetical protein